MNLSNNNIAIEEYLEELKILVRQDWYGIDLDRNKNKDFIEKYGLTDKNIKDILSTLEPQDFINKVETQNNKYNSDYLYIFKKKVSLDNLEYEDELDSIEEVKIYVKTAIPNGDGFKVMVVVSFHEDEI